PSGWLRCRPGINRAGKGLPGGGAGGTTAGCRGRRGGRGSISGWRTRSAPSDGAGEGRGRRAGRGGEGGGEGDRDGQAQGAQGAPPNCQPRHEEGQAQGPSPHCYPGRDRSVSNDGGGSRSVVVWRPACRVQRGGRIRLG